ncbi:MAG: hypothetical protein Q4P15_07710 [Propionibacteriaceae bacterium]|nr:hypothetical protein [Propionibacteriaceae bacterium]
MRILLVTMMCLTLSACALFGPPREFPEGDLWRQQVADAIASTPGVERSDVVIHDVDNGMTKGPVMTGTIIIAAGQDAQKVVDAAMGAAADVMGEKSSGVAISPGITESGQPPGKLRHYDGYEGVNNGEKLWKATR